MRWLLFFLLLPAVDGLSIGASPSTLLFRPLDDVQQLVIMNAGDKGMSFRIDHDRLIEVVPDRGELEAGETARVKVHRNKELKGTGDIRIYAEGEMIAPGLTIPVKIEEKPGKKEIMIKESIIEQKTTKSNIGLTLITLEIIIVVGLWKKFQK